MSCSKCFEVITSLHPPNPKIQFYCYSQFTNGETEAPRTKPRAQVRESQKLVLETPAASTFYSPKSTLVFPTSPVPFIVSITGEETEAPGMKGCFEVTQLVHVWDAQSLSPAPTA